MAQSPEIVLLDIDGTLIDTGGAGGRAWSFAFKQRYGNQVDIGEFTEDGMTDPVIAHTLIERVIGGEPSAEDVSRLLHAYTAAVPDLVHSSPGYRVLDGVVELLDRLSARSVVLGITTGNVEPAAHAKLGRGELNHYFAVGGYGSDSPDRTELTKRALHRAERELGRKADPARVLVIGDTPRDVAAARGAGVVGVGVASGHYTREQLAEAGADAALDSLLDPLPGVEQESAR